jgi:hypothetical protein
LFIHCQEQQLQTGSQLFLFLLLFPSSQQKQVPPIPTNPTHLKAIKNLKKPMKNQQSRKEIKISLNWLKKAKAFVAHECHSCGCVIASGGTIMGKF